MGDVIEARFRPVSRIAMLRRASGRSQTELGIQADELEQWETGEFQMSDEQKACLCDLFGVSVAHLTGTTGPRRQIRGPEIA